MASTLWKNELIHCQYIGQNRPQSFTWTSYRIYFEIRYHLGDLTERLLMNKFYEAPNRFYFGSSSPKIACRMILGNNFWNRECSNKDLNLSDDLNIASITLSDEVFAMKNLRQIHTRIIVEHCIVHGGFWHMIAISLNAHLSHENVRINTNHSVAQNIGHHTLMPQSSITNYRSCMQTNHPQLNTINIQLHSFVGVLLLQAPAIQLSSRKKYKKGRCIHWPHM